MRKTLAAVLVASTMLIAGSALASDPPPPPPPPPDSGDSASSSPNAGGGGLRSPDGLFDTSTGKKRPMLISAFLGIPYGYIGYGFSIAVSGRFYFPILSDGFAPSINDEFGIEGGVDLGTLFYGFGGSNYTWFLLNVPVEAMYDVHLFPKFDVYVKAGLALHLWFGDHVVTGYVPIDFVGAVGLRYKFTDSLYLRAEAGYPFIKIGIGFAF